MADAFVKHGRKTNYTLYDEIHEKTDFTREQPMHQPKVPQKPNFIVTYYYALLCMDLECKLFFLN